ncbi:NUDIX domain-containing protein [Lysinibacter cavernae]|uniref:8-oxo-dGTP pyrophosphatase MutT (NUDIX family) n=1 Tax=Lysinibacter cavernae TaxID=1640652 RepID=A0A7X5TTU3_9MICO|nr:NUDIX hydrolase [Lysinibacter cavernae]NIH54565.1 8-oxo-dGTP pyrophosphatase MutT (NUDIX family) [Lysinibacter cavernae]
MKPPESEPFIPSRLSRVEKYSNPWLTVSEDQVQFSTEHTGPYGIIQKPDFSLVIPTHGEQLALVRQYRYPIAQWRLEFPQGALHHSTADSSPVAAAQQELREETGLLAEEFIPLGSFHESYGLSSCLCHAFVATVSGVAHPEPELTEVITATVWVSPTEFWQLVSNGEITDAASIAAMGLYQSLNRKGS